MGDLQVIGLALVGCGMQALCDPAGVGAWGPQASLSLSLCMVPAADVCRRHGVQLDDALRDLSSNTHLAFTSKKAVTLTFSCCCCCCWFWVVRPAACA